MNIKSQGHKGIEYPIQAPASSYHENERPRGLATLSRNVLLEDCSRIAVYKGSH